MKTSVLLPVLLKAGLFLLGALVAPIATAADAGDEVARAEQQVLAVNAEMIADANRLDVDAFFAHILETDRGLIVQNGTIFRTRREAYDAVKRGLQGVTKLDRRIDSPRVTFVGPDVALLVGDGRTTATLQDGRVMENRFAVSLVFVHSGPTWKLLHGHYSSAAMP
jgi:ketosteroid isomerase-like protein